MQILPRTLTRYVRIQTFVVVNLCGCESSMVGLLSFTRGSDTMETNMLLAGIVVWR